MCWICREGLGVGTRTTFESGGGGRKYDSEMGLGTLGAMHIGSINFINNIISAVTTKTTNCQAPSGPVSLDRRISQRNLAHKHKRTHTALHARLHKQRRAHIQRAHFDTHGGTQRRLSQVDANRDWSGEMACVTVCVCECVFVCSS